MKIEIRRSVPNSPWTYGDLDALQRKLGKEVEAGAEGVLLLNELSPVITLGRRTPETDLLLLPKGVETFETDRGGLATWHGPGQWVLFPVAHMEWLCGDLMGVKKVVRGLLEVAQKTAHYYEPHMEIREGKELGVWSPRGKVSALGVHIAKGVLYHGISINGFKTGLSFQGLRPCGLDLGVDYLLKDVPQEGQERAFQELGERLVKSFFEVFPLPKA